MQYSSTQSFSFRSLSKPIANLAAAFVLLAAPYAAQAATLTVCPAGCDSNTVQGGVLLANAGDTVQILTTTALTETDIVITKNLTIQGIDETQTIIQAATVPGVASGRVFTVLADLQVNFRDLTIRYGYSSASGGGLWIQDGTDPEARVTMERVSVAHNRGRFGGGVYAGSALILDNVDITYNTAYDDGGGIYVARSLESNNIVNVSDNTAENGGGLYLKAPFGTEPTTAELHGIRITRNHATDSTDGSFGGGIYNTGTMIIDAQSHFYFNTAYAAGAFYHGGPGLLTISDTEFHSNETSEPNFGGSTLTGKYGGAIFADGPTHLSRVVLRGNRAHASGQGGAIFVNRYGSLTAERMEIVYNTAGSIGGGISAHGDLALSHSAVYSNTAYSGGGLSLGHFDSVAELTNVSVLDNEATQSGGGIVANGTVSIASSTIASNQLEGGEGGGVYRLPGASVSLRSSILANNYAGPGGSGNDCFNGFTSGSFSLIGNTSGGCGVSGFTAGMITGQGPQLSFPKVIDGFATRYESRFNSPAIDSGACAAAGGGSVTSDQRGAGRPVDGDGDGEADCDMGAYEYLPEPSFGLALALGAGVLSQVRRRR